MSPRTALQTRARGATRRTTLLIAAGATLALVVVVGAVGWAFAPRITSVTPRVGTDATATTVVLFLEHAGGLEAADVHASVNGVDVSKQVDVQGDELHIPLRGLREGDHSVVVSTERFGLMRRKLSRSWTFVVDTTNPNISLTTPVVIGREATSDRRDTELRLRTEPGARVTFSTRDARATSTADARGRVKTSIRLPDGRHRVQVEVRDRVGNTSTDSLRLYVDATAPRVDLKLPARLKHAEWRLPMVVTDAAAVTVEATVDGGSAAVKLEPPRAAGPPAPEVLEPAVTEPVATAEDTLVAAESAPVAVRAANGARWALVPNGRLSEGNHRFVVTATDPMGNRTTVARTILVDSSEQLGETALGRGARGNDVRQLQRLLQEEQLFRRQQAPAEWRARRYGPATTSAVRRYQDAKGLTADGVAGDSTVAALTLRIVIDRASHRLTLYRLDKVVVSYGVAVGSAAYPTPAGTFEIVNKQEDPTWTPPDSDWAKDAKPIPPGPNNPLGTRWMGLDSPNVGIHGTNSPASIGYSVSHGCIRMAIPDVEDLFERVEVGTPVEIV